MMLVRGSEMETFLRCRLKWKYAWVDRLVPTVPNGKLFFGTLFHKFLEIWYESGRDYQKAYDAMTDLYDRTDTSRMEQVELDEIMRLTRAISWNYHQAHVNQDTFEVVATELTFAVPLKGDLVYTGTIDLVYRTADRRLRFMDHKTTISLEKYIKKAVMDRQISRYWWALQRLQKGKGYILNKETNEWMPASKIIDLDGLAGEIDGFDYNLILKDTPEPPKPLKKGGLSKDKSQNTTYDLYIAALKELGQAPPEDPNHPGHYIIPVDHPYYDILVHLSQSGREFFHRLDVRRNQAEINDAIREFYFTSIDMHTVQVDLANSLQQYTYRHITDDCSWDCPFRDVCIAGFDGSNVDLLLQTTFKHDETPNLPQLP